jgi:hypothetical protein
MMFRLPKKNFSALNRFYKYDALDQKGSCIAEYVWIDGTGLNTRSKARTFE